MSRSRSSAARRRRRRGERHRAAGRGRHRSGGDAESRPRLAGRARRPDARSRSARPPPERGRLMARGGGLIIAAPASGSGKTVVTLAILRALTRAGIRVHSFKVGPDYIDPAFHAAATGRPCFNLDPWAMRPATIVHLLDRLGGDAELTLGEGVMGLFDGASDGTGSTADLAATTGWPVIMV